LECVKLLQSCSVLLFSSLIIFVVKLWDIQELFEIFLLADGVLQDVLLILPLLCYVLLHQLLWQHNMTEVSYQVCVNTHLYQ